MHRRLVALVLVAATGCSFSVDGPPPAAPGRRPVPGPCDEHADGRIAVDVFGVIGSVVLTAFSLFALEYGAVNSDESGGASVFALLTVVSLTGDIAYPLAIHQARQRTAACRAAHRAPRP